VIQIQVPITDLAMAPENANIAYMPIHDKDSEEASYRVAARRQKIAFVVIAIGVFACLACVAKPTNLTSVHETKAANSVPKDIFLSNRAKQASGLLQTMAFGVSPHFHGTTEYFIEPDGRLSASIEPGSNSTAFFLDHRFQYIVDGEISVTDGVGHTFFRKSWGPILLAEW
jgi:hypothetical protein